MRAPRSLIGRVTLAAVVAVGLALAVAGVAVVVASSRSDIRSLDRDLERLAGRLGGPAAGLIGRDRPGGFDRYGPAGVPNGPPDDVQDLVRPGGPLDPGADRFTRLIQPNGISLSEGAAVPAGFPVPSQGDTPKTVTVKGDDWRTVVRQLRDGARLQVAARLSGLEGRANRLRLLVLVSVLGALLATALLTRWLVGVALGPLERLRGTAEDVAATADLSVRVPAGEGPEEVDALAGDLNEMLGRLQQSAGEREAALESARRFAADAGHELRTPLTSLRANIATGSIDEAGRDADRLVALVEQLQALARGEAGPPSTVEPVDLGELADAAIVALKMRHPEIDTRLEAPTVGPTISGEPESLRMLLDNLLQNAAHHGRREGTVAVTVAPSPQGAELLIDDDGPGIPPAERERVLERFARGAAAQGPGTGLGLSIAAAQAARYGGDIALQDSPLGGLRVRVRLGAGAGVAAAPG